DAGFAVLLLALRLQIPPYPDAREVAFLVQLLNRADLRVVNDDLADAILRLVLPADGACHEVLDVVDRYRLIVWRPQHRPRDGLLFLIPPDEKQALLGQLTQQLVDARWLGDEGREVVAGQPDVR